MKLAVLILAHKNPEQVARLCRALAHPGFDLFIHLDAKSDIAPFRALIPDAEFIQQRVDVRWGGFSMVRATLNSLREIVAVPEPCDFVMLVSGQDYPVVPMAEIAGHLASHPESQFIYVNKISPENEPLLARRYRYPHVHLKNPKYNARIDRLLRACLPPRRKIPFPAVYKGGQWWTLSRSCVQYILDRCEADGAVERFFRYANCPDELFFQTIIMDSPFAQSVVPQSFRYIDWSAGGHNPAILTSADYDRIVASGAWLSRKFDATIDSQILDMFDEQMAKSDKNSLKNRL